MGVEIEGEYDPVWFCQTYNTITIEYDAQDAATKKKTEREKKGARTLTRRKNRTCEKNLNVPLDTASIEAIQIVARIPTRHRRSSHHLA